jgi:hypothetical protein
MLRVKLAKGHNRLQIYVDPTQDKTLSADKSHASSNNLATPFG